MKPRTRRSHPRLAIAATTAAVMAAAPIASARRPAYDPSRAYEPVVSSVAGMVSDGDAVEKASGKGLRILNVMWEDTGRSMGSSVGPNISDVTIEVEAWRRGDQHRTYLMPVIRHDNFTDKTGDVKLDKVWVPVGNQTGDRLKTVSLRELLAHPTRYLSAPRTGRIAGGSLLAERDTHALVSAQHAFLPVPKDGKATFWPVIFNYQSTVKNPAVLTILVTRQGTSMTIVDNARDTTSGGSWGQRLYFNHDGEKAPLIAERLKDVKRSGVTANGEDASTLGADANLLMLIQVPLKYRQPQRGISIGAGDAEMAADMPAPAPSAPSAASAGAPMKMERRQESDVDVAVLGHGTAEGPYTELDGLRVERDPRFPIRVTVQFYQATSNGVVSQADIDRMAAQIDRVYASADYVGSLVVPAPRDRVRPTHWNRVGFESGEDAFPGLTERQGRFGWWSMPVPQQAIGIDD